ncbi:MAG: Carbon monoxide dehydrogenase medium chain [Syntrophorhabdaceae bacterium PtaU1.Bin034]|nr:MAG: Carbon monoxide dehydrogenase medium chain [Syntrophorhabdaceae bacterium PtaU1.Bin034]
MKRYDYYKPGSIQEAVGLMQQLDGQAVYIAGGTDLMVLMRQKKLSPKALISLRNIKELSHRDEMTIGAGVTHGEIQKDEIIKKRFSALHDAVCHLGSTQIRNVATIGGNICNAAPSADTACPLLVLDAKAVVVGAAGKREVPIDDFFVGPGKTVLEKGEILKQFNVPVFGENTGSAYIKHTRRAAMDLPILGIAVRITVNKSDLRCKDMLCSTAPASEILSYFGDEDLKCEDIRIAMGVVAPRPIRAKKAEDELRGKIITDKTVTRIAEIAASESSPRDSVRGEAWYRREMVKVLVQRAVMKSIDRIVRPDELVYPDRLW